MSLTPWRAASAIRPLIRRMAGASSDVSSRSSARRVARRGGRDRRRSRAIAGRAGRRLAAHRIVVAEQPVERVGARPARSANGRAEPAPQLDQRPADRRPRASRLRAGRPPRRSARSRGGARRRRGCGRRGRFRRLRRPSPRRSSRSRLLAPRRRSASALRPARRRLPARAADARQPGRIDHDVVGLQLGAARSAAPCRDSRGPARRWSARGSGCCASCWSRT